jgi:hypothetical protein
MQSKEFADDIKNFNVSDIVDVEPHTFNRFSAPLTGGCGIDWAVAEDHANNWRPAQVQ